MIPGLYFHTPKCPKRPSGREAEEMGRRLAVLQRLRAVRRGGDWTPSQALPSVSTGGFAWPLELAPPGW